MNEEPLIVCLDVDYRDVGAMAAGLWFRSWASPSGVHEATRFFSNPAPYEPGAFYRRELPCLLGVLERGPDPDIVVVDGYMELVDGEPGLGSPPPQGDRSARHRRRQDSVLGSRSRGGSSR